MAWFKLDDQVANHPKTLAAKNEAFGAWARMGSHASAYLTDGFITPAVAIAIAERQDVIDRLVEVGYLDVVDGGYQVHDYLDWNPSADDVKAKRSTEKARKDAARGKQGRDERGRMLSDPLPAGVRADVERIPRGRGTDSAPLPCGGCAESEILPPVPSPSPSPVVLSKNSAREAAPPTPDRLVALLATSAELADANVGLDRLARTLRADTIGGGWSEMRIADCLVVVLDKLALSSKPELNPHGFVVQTVRRLARPGALEVENKAQDVKMHWRTERAAATVEKYQASKGESSDDFAAREAAEAEKLEHETAQRRRRTGTGEQTAGDLFGRKGAA